MRRNLHKQRGFGGPEGFFIILGIIAIIGLFVSEPHHSCPGDPGCHNALSKTNIEETNDTNPAESAELKSEEKEVEHACAECPAGKAK